MHVSTDFRGVLKMTLNVLQRYAADSPSAKDIALELERSGGNMVALVAELEEQLAKEKAECERMWDDRLRGLKIAYQVTEDCQSVEEACAELVRIVRAQTERANSAESALAAAREDKMEVQYALAHSQESLGGKCRCKFDRHGNRVSSCAAHAQIEKDIRDTALRAQLAAAEERAREAEDAQAWVCIDCNEVFPYSSVKQDGGLNLVCPKCVRFPHTKREVDLDRAVSAARSDAVREFAEWLDKNSKRDEHGNGTIIEEPTDAVDRYLAEKKK